MESSNPGDISSTDSSDPPSTSVSIGSTRQYNGSSLSTPANTQPTAAIRAFNSWGFEDLLQGYDSQQSFRDGTSEPIHAGQQHEEAAESADLSEGLPSLSSDPKSTDVTTGQDIGPSLSIPAATQPHISLDMGIINSPGAAGNTLEGDQCLLGMEDSTTRPIQESSRSADQEYGSHQVASSPGGPIRAAHCHRGGSRSAYTYSSNGLPSPSSAPRWKNILTGPRNQNILTSFSMPMATHQTSTDPMGMISFKVLEGYESQPRLTDSTTEPIHDQVAFSSHPQQSTRFAFHSNCSDFVASLPGRPIHTGHFNGTGSRPEIPDSSNGTASQSSDPRSTKIHTGPASQNIGTSLSMPAATQSQSAGPMGTVSVNGLEGSTTGHVPNIVRASSHLQESRRSPFCSSGSHGAEHYHGRQAEYPHPNSYRTCSTTRPYTNENFLTSLSKPVNTHQPHSTSGPIHAAHFNGISSRTENSNSNKQLASQSSGPRSKKINIGPITMSMPATTQPQIAGPMGAVNINELEDNTLQGLHSQPKLTDSMTEPIPDNVAISSHLQESTRSVVHSSASHGIASSSGGRYHVQGAGFLHPNSYRPYTATRQNGYINQDPQNGIHGNEHIWLHPNKMNTLAKNSSTRPIMRAPAVPLYQVPGSSYPSYPPVRPVGVAHQNVGFQQQHPSVQQSPNRRAGAPHFSVSPSQIAGARPPYLNGLSFQERKQLVQQYINDFQDGPISPALNLDFLYTKDEHRHCAHCLQDYSLPSDTKLGCGHRVHSVCATDPDYEGVPCVFCIYGSSVVL